MLPDVIGGHQAYSQRKIYLWRLEFGSWLRPRAVSRVRARLALDEIIKSLPSESMQHLSWTFFSESLLIMGIRMIRTPRHFH